MKYLKLTVIPIAAALALGGVALAQQASPSSPSGAMDHEHMMQGGGSSAMPMMGIMREMSTMIENCNKMMQSMMDQQKQGAPAQQQPEPQPKGG